MAYPETSISWEKAEEAIKRKREKERQEIKRPLSILEARLDSRLEDKHIIMADGGCGQITNRAYPVYFKHVLLRIL